MTNVNVKCEGTKMTIEVDLAQDHGLSASGKTKIIASSHGFQKLSTPVGEVSVGINVVKKK